MDIINIIRIYENSKYHDEISTTRVVVKVSPMQYQCFHLNLTTCLKRFEDTEDDDDDAREIEIERDATYIHDHIEELKANINADRKEYLIHTKSFTDQLPSDIKRRFTYDTFLPAVENHKRKCKELLIYAEERLRKLESA